MSDYRICAHCVMDTSDSRITFDQEGVCCHCHRYHKLIKQFVWSEERRRRELPGLIDSVKAAGRGRDYDCLIGVSGGVDSTFVAYQVKQFGLRALAAHLDNGWNSSVAVTNIHRTLDKLGIDLVTEVLDWEEFKDLQLAFLRASTPDCEIPTDHAIRALLIATARKHGIRYIISGGNIRTEGIMPPAWSQGMGDWKYIREVHRRFGTRPLKSYPHFTLLEDVLSQSIYGLKWVRLLNCIDYNKVRAMAVLQEELGWEYYGGKHHESVYTRFFQSYILPMKFGVDKRRAHLSCQINCGEITRDAALAELQNPICPPDLLLQDKEFVIKKFGITSAEFDDIMDLPRRTIGDYPAYEHGVLLRVLRFIYRLPRKWCL